MFGYVRPLRAELKVKTLEQYQAAYCGLCRSLGKNFGFAARFTVSYDLLFLYLILDGMQQEPPRERCRCPAKPWRKCACIAGSDALTQTAAVNVILTYWKLDDAVRDEHGLRKLGARLGKLALRRSYRKAARQCPQLDQLVQNQLEKLSAFEQAKEPSMDRHADAFSEILRAMADFFEDPMLSRPTRELLGHVGRFLYLTDALDDLPKDLRTGAFNPLIERFGVCDGALQQENRQYLIQSIDQSLDLAAAALELLPLKGSDEILHNIVYLGLPAVLKSVANGTFHRRDQKIRSRL